MQSLLAVVLVLLVATTAQTLSAPSPRCGRHLADLLAIVCKGRGYNNPLHYDLPAQPPPTGQKTSRAKRGVVEECCKVGCTFSTLEQYCSEPASVETHRPGDMNHVGAATYNRVRHQDLPKKARGRQHKKKGKRRNGKCRCERRHRRRKFDLERTERMMRDQPAFQVGTVASPFVGEPVIIPRLKHSP